MIDELEKEIRENFRKMDSESLIEIARNAGDAYTEQAVELAGDDLRKRGVEKIPPEEEEESVPPRPGVRRAVMEDDRAAAAALLEELGADSAG